MKNLPLILAILGGLAAGLSDPPNATVLDVILGAAIWYLIGAVIVTVVERIRS